MAFELFPVISRCWLPWTSMHVYFCRVYTQGVELLGYRPGAFSTLEIITIHHPQRLHRWKLTLDVCASSHDSEFTAST